MTFAAIMALATTGQQYHKQWCIQDECFPFSTQRKCFTYLLSSSSSAISCSNNSSSSCLFVSCLEHTDSNTSISLPLRSSQWMIFRLKLGFFSERVHIRHFWEGHEFFIWHRPRNGDKGLLQVPRQSQWNPDFNNSVYLQVLWHLKVNRRSTVRV